MCIFIPYLPDNTTMDPSLYEYGLRVRKELSEQHFTKLEEFTTPAERNAHYQAVVLAFLAKELAHGHLAHLVRDRPRRQ